MEGLHVDTNYYARLFCGTRDFQIRRYQVATEKYSRSRIKDFLWSSVAQTPTNLKTCVHVPDPREIGHATSPSQPLMPFLKHSSGTLLLFTLILQKGPGTETKSTRLMIRETTPINRKLNPATGEDNSSKGINSTKEWIKICEGGDYNYLKKEARYYERRQFLKSEVIISSGKKSKNIRGTDTKPL